MEGIHFILFKLLMRRHRNLHYCFEILTKNGQFESLLGQFDEERCNRCNTFKDVIVDCLHEYYSDDKENYRLVELNFQMYHELAQISESKAKQIVYSELLKLEKKINNEISAAALNLAKPFTMDQMDAISTSTFTINGNLSSANVSGVNFLVCNKHLVESHQWINMQV